MRKILLPFDGSDSSKRAVQYLADQLKDLKDQSKVQVHVLNVQENPVYFDGVIDGAVMKEIEAAQLEGGRRTTLEAAALLQQASIPHQLHVEIGMPAETIAKRTETLGCQSIIMGTRGLGSLSGLLLGSVATKVIHLAHVPVTLVR